MGKYGGQSSEQASTCTSNEERKNENTMLYYAKADL